MHNRLRKWLATLAVPALGLGLGLAVSTATPAHAATPLFTATTQITDNPDSGGGGIWADDYLTRTLSISDDGGNPGDCGGLSGWNPADHCYSASISDTGYAQTIPGAYQPNQGTATSAQIVSPTEQVPFTGTATYFFYVDASCTTTDCVPNGSGTVDTTLNDGGVVPTDTRNLTSDWFLQAFPDTPAFNTGAEYVVGSIETWSWTYTDGCSTGPWIDAYNNNAGQSSPLPVDGNIVGGGLCATDLVSVNNPGTISSTVNVATSLQVVASDSLSKTLTYSASGLPAGMSINTVTGLISGTPTALGDYSPTVGATDGSASASESFDWNIVTVTVAPPPTTIAGPGAISSFTDYSRSCVDNRNGQWVSGNELQLWTCGADAGRDQQAILVSFNGHEVLGFLVPSGLPQGPWCVTDNGVGQRLTITGCTGNANQQISKQGPYYKFADGTVMDDAGYATYNGAPVIDYAQNFGRNQRFSLP